MPNHFKKDERYIGLTIDLFIKRTLSEKLKKWFVLRQIRPKR